MLGSRSERDNRLSCANESGHLLSSNELLFRLWNSNLRRAMIFKTLASFQGIFQSTSSRNDCKFIRFNHFESIRNHFEIVLISLPLSFFLQVAGAAWCRPAEKLPAEMSSTESTPTIFQFHSLSVSTTQTLGSGGTEIFVIRLLHTQRTPPNTS